MSRALTLLLATTLLACGGAGDPVARLTAGERNLTLAHGRLVPLELRWEVQRPLDGAEAAPVVFVHLLDAEGAVVRTFDHPLRGKWEPGKTLVDRVELVQPVLAPPLTAGQYRLTGGLYDGGSRRWPLDTDAEEVARQEYLLATVEVPEVDANGPRFAFSEQWLPTEPIGDRQTVTRRWLSTEGALEVSGLAAPATVALRLQIPRNEPPLRVVFEPGATVPTVTVVSECSGFAATVSGEGHHALDVPVPPPGRCRIRFDPSFTVLEPGSPRKLSVALEQLAWTPLPPGTVLPPPVVASPSPAASPSPSPAPVP
jgi:hypothetical protein